MISLVKRVLVTSTVIAICNGLCFQARKGIATKSNSRWIGLDMSSSESSIATTDKTILEENISKLKRVLNKEYTTFFSPMYKEYYKENVKFLDPLTSLEGVAQYAANVDMLAGRTLLGSLLFEDAGISLHSVTGGDVVEGEGGESVISDITTRWTLRLTAKVIPWKPKAQFSGVSVYKVSQSSSPQGVEITAQEDYWDSINIRDNGTGDYTPVSKTKALEDFLGQLRPQGYTAELLAPELPYVLLRRGNGYQVRSYPASAVCTMSYSRRDEAFAVLGSFTEDSKVKPLSPALIQVSIPSFEKSMSWPVAFAKPGQEHPDFPPNLISTATVKLETIPGRTVAVIQFDETSTEQAVRKYDSQLRDLLKRDALVTDEASNGALTFAQYDAIYSLGKRRNEVWITLDASDAANPW